MQSMLNHLSFSVVSLLPAIFVWTLLAGLLALVVKYATNLNPIIRYHLSAAVIFALPVGMVLSQLLDFSWLFTQNSAIGFAILPVVEMQPVFIFGDGTETTSALSEGFTLSLGNLFTGIILVCALIGLIRFVVIYFKLRRACSSAKPVTESYKLDLLQSVRSTLSIERKIGLSTMKDVSIPFTTGTFHPMIILPETHTSDSESLRIILMHEGIHIKRNDYGIHFFELMIRHIFWLHPLVHMLYKQSAYWREVSCDASVLKKCNPKTENYARLLYEFALSSNEKPTFKAAMAEESNLLRRIRAFTSQTNTNKEITMKKSITIACTLFLMIGGVMACTNTIDGEDKAAAETQLPVDPDTPTPPTPPEPPEPIDGTDVFKVVETMPEMIGGQEAFFSHLQYPEKAQNEGLEGRAVIEFIVDEDGAVTEPKVVRSSDHPILDDAALSAIQKVSFTPGVQRGKNVKVQMVQPVVFKLQ